MYYYKSEKKSQVAPPLLCFHPYFCFVSMFCVDKLHACNVEKHSICKYIIHMAREL
jgi:hypothetical protein